MGNDLDRAAQVVATPFLGDDLGVDLAGGHVAGLAEVGVDEPFVMAEIEVGLGAVVRHEDLTVLVRGHRARIDVDVRVQLLEGDAQPAGLEDGPDGRCRNPLADRGNHATGYEDVLRHRGFILPRGTGRRASMFSRMSDRVFHWAHDVVRSSSVSVRPDRQL